MKTDNHMTRRKFIQKSAVLGTGILVAGNATLIAKQTQGGNMSQNIKSKGYAAPAWDFRKR